MKLVRLRERACRLGLVVEERTKDFVVSNCGATRNLKEQVAALLGEHRWPQR